MFKTIEKLQKKPKEERRRFGLTAAGLITFIIFLVWLSTLGRGDTAVPDASEERGAIDIATPLETVSSNFGILVEGLKEQLSELDI